MPDKVESKPLENKPLDRETRDKLMQAPSIERLTLLQVGEHIEANILMYDGVEVLTITCQHSYKHNAYKADRIANASIYTHEPEMSFEQIKRGIWKRIT